MTTTALFWLVLFLFNDYGAQCAQPYFPPQITFSFYNDFDRLITFAVDEFNQRAYRLFDHGQGDYAYVMKNFPFPIPDSPESKYYVQMYSIYPPLISCYYSAYWEYGGDVMNSFPSHWRHNSSSFKIENYMKFNYKMIHSTNQSVLEDYWYSDEKCQVSSGEYYPCEEIYFTKNTDIPLRTVQVGVQEGYTVQITTKYTVMSIGKPAEKLFEPIPLDWVYSCGDVSLGLIYSTKSLVLKMNESATIELYLSAPPHRINENSTTSIGFSLDLSSSCDHCLQWKPKRFVFNTDNFRQAQKLTITRIKTGTARLWPNAVGGGYERAMGVVYTILVG